MILINKVTPFANETFQKDLIECIQHNIDIGFISSIIVFHNNPNIVLPKHNKVKLIVKNSYTDKDIIEYCKLISNHDIFIFANPFIKFNNTLINLEKPLKSVTKLGNDCFIFNRNEIIIGSSIDTIFKCTISNNKISIDRKNIWTEEIKKNITRVNKIKPKELVIKDKIKIDAVIVSVDYNDFLSITLEKIASMMNVTVVTSSNDIICQSICEKYGANCVVTDRMYENESVFNKGKAINEGLKSIKDPDWILILDADIYLKDDILSVIEQSNTDINNLLICKRLIIKNEEDFIKWKNGEDLGRIERAKGFGYFQLFNAKSNSNRKFFYSEEFEDASFSDIEFRDRFKVKEELNTYVVHLGETNQNWSGRITEKFTEDGIFDMSKKSKFKICTYYFNFKNDSRQKNNLIKFLEQFSDRYEDVIIGLIDYGDIDFDIPCESVIIKGDNNNKLWSKEILINKIIEKVECEYLIWIDSDLIYDSLDWLDNIDLVVKDNDFVQLFENINYLGENNELLESHKSIISGGDKNIDKLLSKGFRPGGSWLGRTSILKENKLFEKMYVGGGDTIFLYGLFGVNDGYTLEKVGEGSKEIKKDAIEWINKFGNYKVGYISESINHLYHGNLKDRNYNNRYKDLSKFSNKIDTLTIKDDEIDKIIIKNKIVVYTCISGNYDSLKDITKKEPDIDYICFTNQDIISDDWEIRKIPEYLKSLEQTKIARCIKILPHLFLPEYEISVWVDGNIQILGNINKFISENPFNYFSISKHPDRICTYEEAEAVINLNKENSDIVNKQIEKYRNNGFPENNGMIQSGIMIRKHNNKECVDISNSWWYEVKKWSKRDQLSFNYSIWNKKVEINIMNPSIISSEYFQIWSHVSKGNKKSYLRKDYGSIKNYINGVEV